MERAVMVMVSNQSRMEFGYLAGRYPGSIGHLYSPGGQRTPHPWLPYALDNGAWGAYKNGKKWDPEPWYHLLRWAALSGQRPLWALVPDVVGDAEATLTNWHQYEHEVRRYGFRPAFAAQDGMVPSDVPAKDCVIFMGGSTGWKDASIERWCRELPGRVHVGRVNKMDRLLRCYRAGVISVDGTGWWHKSGASNQLGELTRFVQEVHGGM